MKELKIYFAVLQYIPSSIRRESLDVGVAVHIPTLGIAKFFSTRNLPRVASFDDEYDPEFFKMMMDSLKYDIDFPVDKNNELISLGDEERFDNLASDTYLHEKTSYLANEFVFLPIKSIKSSVVDYKKDIEALQKTYLYYDRPKPKRISAQQVKSLLHRQLNYAGIKSESLTDTPTATFTDKPFFDINLNDQFIKTMSFDYSKKGQMSRELKSILFDLRQISESSINKKIKIVVDDKASKSDEYKKFIQILNDISSETQSTTISVKTISSFMTSVD